MRIKKMLFPIMTLFILSSCSFPIVPSSSTEDSSASGGSSISEEESVSDTTPSIVISESDPSTTTSEDNPSTSISGSESTSSGSEELKKVEMGRTIQDYVDNNVYSIDNTPINGSPKLLVIPTWFTDSSTYINSSYKDNIKSDIELAFNGSESDTGWHSVKTYYETVSGGEFTPSVTVSDWYNSSYSVRSAGTMDEYDTGSFVQTAANWYFNNNPSESRSDYDYDADGFIDGVLLIYAAPNYSNSSLSYSYESYSNFWAYCYWVQDAPNLNNPVPNAFFWASYDFIYGYSTARERSGANYYGGDTSNCTVDAHTFIHELGHIIGYDFDLYDTNGNYTPSGGFSMQDMNVGGHDPFSVLIAGWAEPYIPTETTTITIGSFQKTHDLILLTNDWNNANSPFDEYLLLELYTPTGLNEFDASHQYDQYPQGPSGVGLRVWHVDARLTTTTNEYVANFTTSLFNDPLDCEYGATLAMSNTSYDPYGYNNAYIPILEYADYNLLQLIRNDVNETYTPEQYLDNNDLFGNGSSFNMSTYRRQFVESSGNTALLNSGESLGWSFSVSISGSGHDATATVTCTKN